MKKVIAIVLAVTLLASLSGVALAGKGNDLPSGPHYNLNIIGMAEGKEKNPEMDCGNGHRIFVTMGKNEFKRTKINLVEADEALPQEEAFRVTDCNGTDGVAEFTLPNPDPNNDGVTEYSVYIRLRGNPGGRVKMTTCATEPDTGEEVCSDLQVIEVREQGKGKNKFNNVSAELLYIYAWVCVEPDPEDGCLEYEYMRVPLFSDVLEDYLWYYDNKGNRIAQLRFYYHVETEVPDPGLAAVSPDSGCQGETLNVTITGTPDFGDATGVSFGAGITVDSFNGSPQKLTATITIDGAATAGPRDVSVTFPEGTLTLEDGFEVMTCF